MAIVAIMKDESQYIADWIRFHAIAGVKSFFLYDDGSTDETIAQAKSVSGVEITIIPWKFGVAIEKPRIELSRQVLAYCHAICNFGSAFRWMAFIDIDEYIVPVEATSIDEVLASLNESTNVSLPWTTFGPNGHRDPPEIPVPFAYTTAVGPRPGLLLNFKCIVDPCQVTRAGVHRFFTASMGESSANDVGMIAHYKRRKRLDFLSSRRLQLNHYFTRSLGDMERKIERGSASGWSSMKHGTAIRAKFALLCGNLEQDNVAVKFLERHGIHAPEDFRLSK